MNPIKPQQRALALAAAALVSVALAEAVVGHVFEADAQKLFAQSAPAPAAAVAAAPQRVAVAPVAPRP
jgi:hypothetical protein